MKDITSKSVIGMTSEQIWSEAVSTVNKTGGSKFKAYKLVADELLQLSELVLVDAKKRTLKALASAALAAGDEARWAILCNKEKLKEANKKKWNLLKVAKVIK